MSKHLRGKWEGSPGPHNYRTLSQTHKHAHIRKKKKENQTVGKLDDSFNNWSTLSLFYFYIQIPFFLPHDWSSRTLTHVIGICTHPNGKLDASHKGNGSRWEKGVGKGVRGGFTSLPRREKFQWKLVLAFKRLKLIYLVAVNFLHFLHFTMSRRKQPKVPFKESTERNWIELINWETKKD